MRYIAWFKDLSKKDIPLVGGKAANLGELYNIRLPTPTGFVVTADAYKYFLKKTGILSEIKQLLSDINLDEQEKFIDAAEKIQELILESEMPEDIIAEIREAYDHLNVNIDVYKMANKSALDFIKAGRDLPYVAVRSSATAEDLPEASFAGQQETFLNIKGTNNVLEAVKGCWASLFTPRAIYYRQKNNFAHEKVFIAVVVQKMVNSDKSGVMFTINPSTNKDEIMIEAGFGLGELIVAGKINPDNYIIDKQTMKIKDKIINIKDYMLTRDENLGRTVRKNLSEEQATSQVLTDSEIIKLAEFGIIIEEHYQKPMDIEFGVENNKIYILQARPITTIKIAQKKIQESKELESEQEGKQILLKGLAASPGIASGKVKVVASLNDLIKVKKGDILVTKMTNPDMVPTMERAVAIVTDAGGITSHAAIVSRELGIPCIVGTMEATQILKDRQEITVDGTTGTVYSGEAEIQQSIPEEIELTREDMYTKTKIYMNLGEPDKIDEYISLPFDGIGLMRIEFIITSEIKKHPLALIKENKSQEYIDKLKQGILKIAEAIHPRPIIVRFSDFKSNEYKNLEGGEEFEPDEDNPMIGLRGVSRYISEEFKEVFKLECQAIQEIRENYDNVHVMLPFVRTTQEVFECLKIMEEYNLRSNSDFKIFLMAEVPSMALIPDDFAQLPIDGVSIGSNDLTQLVLGVDRDSALLGKMNYFDERNKAVLQAMYNIITIFKRYNKSVSICGQSPSVYPEIVEFLVKNNITSISVNPDAVIKTRKLVSSIERSHI